MSILLDKIIPLFVYPTGFIVLSALLCLLFLTWNWRRAAITWLLVGTLYVWLCATPVFARLLADTLEGSFPVKAVEQLPEADVIIMLGGTLSPPGQWNPYGDLDSAADRIIETARLYRAGKAPRVQDHVARRHFGVAQARYRPAADRWCAAGRCQPGSMVCVDCPRSRTRRDHQD